MTMKHKYKKFYIMFVERVKNLIFYSNLNSDGGVEITRYYANTCKKFY